MSATDTDAGDNVTGYGIVADADGAQFSIVAETGELSFKAAPNYEDPNSHLFSTEIEHSPFQVALDNTGPF